MKQDRRKAGTPAYDPTLLDEMREQENERERHSVMGRLTRIESKVTALMKHSGMETDGRNPIKDRKPKA